jgi:hypothetical protein
MNYSDPVDLLAAIRQHTRPCRASHYCEILLQSADRLVHILELYYGICKPEAVNELQAIANRTFYPDSVHLMHTQCFPTIDKQTLVLCLKALSSLNDALLQATLEQDLGKCADLKNQITQYCDYLKHSRNSSGECIDYRTLTTNAKIAVQTAIDRLIARIRPFDPKLAEVMARSIVINYRSVWIMQYGLFKDEV